jgi:hypothetical protein
VFGRLLLCCALPLGVVSRTLKKSLREPSSDSNHQKQAQLCRPPTKSVHYTNNLARHLEIRSSGIESVQNCSLLSILKHKPETISIPKHTAHCPANVSLVHLASAIRCVGQHFIWAESARFRAAQDLSAHQVQIGTTSATSSCAYSTHALECCATSRWSRIRASLQSR